jgi:hypothetical protein
VYFFNQGAMKNILIFNDFSRESEHATELALLLAGKLNVNLYVWNVFDQSHETLTRELAAINAGEGMPEIELDNNHWIERLESKLNWQSGLMPVVRFIDEIEYAPENIFRVTQKYDVGLLIKGIAPNEDGLLSVSAEALGCATKSGCPVLFIPEKYEYKAFEKMVYATDLRFCRREVVTFLTQLARPLDANILIANIPAEGLPYMEDGYAKSVFEKGTFNPGNYEHIYFSNIRERNIPKAIDVLINGMNNDLLVMMNHKFHFNELLGHHLPYILPDSVAVPLLIFPL